MASRIYSASLCKSQGRLGYSVIFRHPARLDQATGKPGLRVRRGLGTRDEAEAERLRSQLDTLLANPRYHSLAGRTEAERRFDERVVDIFFDKMVPEAFDFASLREDVIPLPPQEPDGYRHVLLLGTTGAGKTTLVRQLIGTDPLTERFPSTSTAKTTIHDTEIILDDGHWRAVVTFVSSDEAREYVNDCISEAVLAAMKEEDDASVLRYLLNHVDQRFRLNYILGNGPQGLDGIPDFNDFEDDFEDGESDEDSELPSPEKLDEIDMEVTEDLLVQSVARVRELAVRIRDQLSHEFDASDEDDKRVIEEMLEEHRDDLLREDGEFHEIADALIDAIEKRFSLLPPGSVNKTRQGWPLFWQAEWPVEERSEFLRSISRFSSNYARFFGHLLTPLVNGVRVAGPFSPSWANGEINRLVLFDGEGLGHTPKSSSSVSTSVSERIEAVDAVLLVDNATQPMQAAPVAAIREVVVTGNGRKLLLAFTHFDEVTGDNLPRVSQKANHVLASAGNVLTAFGEELGASAERILRTRVQTARFFLANLQDPLTKKTSAGRRTLGQLRKLLEAIDQVAEKPPVSEGMPVYDRMNLALAISRAASAFHEKWRARLGIEMRPEIRKEHWARVKALNRRLATMRLDEYGDLKPVADLATELKEQIYLFIQNPLRWEGPEPSDEERQGKYDGIADSLNRRIRELSTRRLWQERMSEWVLAYSKSGRGSTFVRADIIDKEIYEVAAPVPDVTPSPHRNQFLREVVAAVDEAAKDGKAKLV